MSSASALDQRSEWITTPPFGGRRDACNELGAREVAGAIDEQRELLGVARLTSGRRAAAALEQLVQHGDRRVVGPFPAHQLIEEGAVERE